ncbi:MAG: BON domain-containing protein [Gammaproteobacteria bacterium]|nr:BON domain-containing protein [Gammaproteobacteria bacterium]
MLLIGAAFAGCAAAPCTSESCKADAKITEAVRAKLKEHSELGGPNTVYVQTRDGIVYLTGQVVTDLQRETAENVANTVPGVQRVVNSIALSFGGR